ncbi:MAG: T9SS type A sorting domain-containing protein [Ignavibacteriales bacterium]|nr:T9SS type A sorting domain-containing protein [Ignavibacteriales bacterium]
MKSLILALLTFLIISIIAFPQVVSNESICELKAKTLLKKNPAEIQTVNFYNYIAINEVKMWASNNGSGCTTPSGAGFLWPGGENATLSAIFADGLIWGGKVNNQVTVNGNTHRTAFAAGKILPNGLPDDPTLMGNRVYKIRKDWMSLPQGEKRDAYQKDLTEWPVWDGAPWKDANGNGSYDVGEANFYGDEVLWSVSNDLDSVKSNYNFGNNPFGFEVQTCIYAFNQPGLENVVFKKQTIINKGNSNVEDMYLGYFVDPDLGNAVDDYAGSHPVLNMVYCYNSDNKDEAQYGGYGTAPPAVGYMILQGPIVPGTQNDSAIINDRWKTGYKNLPLTSFMLYNCGSTIYGCPAYGDAIPYYNGLKGLMKDGNPIIDPVTGQATTLVLNGDPSTKTGWYEGAGWPGGLPAGERYFIFSSGPFNFAPGDTQEVVIAIAIARGTDNINSVSVLKNTKLEVQNFFNRSVTEVQKSSDQIPAKFELYQNYPNPFNPSTTISFVIPNSSFVILKIFDILGEEVATLINEELTAGIHHYTLSTVNYKLSSGVYFYQLKVGNSIETKKLVLMK